MRPIKLVMTGFESYKDRTEISFEKLGSKGLYLITGDTGAGKTTIFDAIPLHFMEKQVEMIEIQRCCALILQMKKLQL